MPLTKIPRNIFQTWSTKIISDKFQSLTKTWRENNPNYEYILFDDDDCEQFIKNNFDEEVYDSYNKIIPGAFKADLWRYCMLYIYGGIYVDIDTICLGKIDDFLDEKIEFITPIDLNNCPYYGTYNLFNAFIASVPKHPILLNCINKIVHNVQNNIVPFSNLDFSGPGILGKSVNIYLGLDETTSFIGKEGISEKNIKLLQFIQGIEYVKDIDNNTILFQNKNGNPDIKNIYNNEIKNTNHICWGKCANPIKQPDIEEKNVTIVTMFYNIREKECNDSNSQFNHSIEKYINYAKQFILKLNYNLIIFTDNDVIKNIVKEERKELSDKTFIVNKLFEDTYYYKHLNILTDLQTKFNIVNGHVEHETPMYIILNNDKFDFIESAINLNPFNSSHFIWMDFGINHVAANPEVIDEWINYVPDKIKQLCINPYIEKVDDKEMFKYIYHHVAGGLFSGSSKNLLTYCELFRQKTEQIYNDNWYQIDEAVMTMVIRENSQLFDLFYGDYNGIISNYFFPIHNIDLILRSSQKYITSNYTNNAYNILNYCSIYFDKNPFDENNINYIHQHIIVDYYNNNHCLTERLIILINLLIQTNNQNIIILLENNKDNINYYDNAHLIK
jgi:hypothetical protein